MVPLMAGRDSFQIVASQAAFGMTKESEEWAVRALSPCDERLQDGRQIPDMATPASAVITNRILTTITPPSVPGATMWNLAALSPPLPDVAFMYKKWDPMTQDPLTVAWTVVPYADVKPGTLAAIRGVNANLSLTYTVDSGTLHGSAEQVRQTQKGHTFSLNASALNDQGMVLIAQYGDKLTKASDLVIATQQALTDPEPDDRNIGSALIITDVPLTTDAIFAKDPHAVRQNARLGAYVPLKLNDPVTLFEPVGENVYRGAVSPVTAPPYPGPLPVALQTDIPNDPDTQYPTLITVGPPIVEDNVTWDQILASVCPTNMQTGIVFFEGLSVSASIDVKTVAALEVVATGRSPWTGFMSESPDDSEEVQRRVHEMQKKMASGYPASFNFLGTLLSNVLPYLGMAAAHVARGLYTKYVRPWLTRDGGQNLRESQRQRNIGSYIEPSLD